MSKKHKKSVKKTEFSLDNVPVAEKEKQDNEFFFENEEAVKNNAPEPEKQETAVAEEATAEEIHETEPEEVKEDAQEAEEAEETEESAKTEEFANTTAGSEKTKGEVAYFLKIAGALTLICSFVALMLAAVNMITKDIIAENSVKEKTAAVTQIFTDADDAYAFAGYSGEEEIFLVEKENKLYGYCVSVTSQGYGGEIAMMVGIRCDGKVEGVRIVSMSETAGLGSKTKNASFLAQYIDKYGPFTVGENVDAVSGATVSSKAVTAGVNDALSVPITPSEIAASRGIEIYHEDGDSSEDITEISSETEDLSEDTDVANGADERQEILNAMTQAAEDTHIDPASAGQYQTKYYYEEEKSYTANRENGYYLEKETTDTEAATDMESETTEASETEV